MVSELLQTYRNRGTAELAKQLRAEAEQGRNLAPLREAVLRENGGKSAEIEVALHPRMMASVEFANRQLRESGIDFMVFVGKEDLTQPDPTEPFKSDETAYRRWRLARMATVPIIGFAACLAEAGLMGIGDGGPSAIPTLARAVTILGLELQFSAFSNWWSRNFWSDDRRLVPWDLPLVRSSDGAELTRKTGVLVGLANKVIGGLNSATGAVKRSHGYNYLVNYLYTGVVYVAGLSAAMVSGHGMADMSFIRVVSDSFVITTAFYFAFGMNQIMLGSLLKRGEISELSRFRRETGALWWNAFGRAVSLVPGLKKLGLGMQLSFGAFVTLPTAVKMAGRKSFNERTRRIFEATESGMIPSSPSICQRLLTRLMS